MLQFLLHKSFQASPSLNQQQYLPLQKGNLQNSFNMKAIVALIFLGVVAVSYAGFAGLGYTSLGYAGAPLGYAGAPLGYAGAHFAAPYAYTAGYSALAGNYGLKLDTTLPGSAYASYPYAAAPTAYGYGVIKTL